MAFQYLESTLHAIVVAMPDKPRDKLSGEKQPLLKWLKLFTTVLCRAVVCWLFRKPVNLLKKRSVIG